MRRSIQFTRKLTLKIVNILSSKSNFCSKKNRKYIKVVIKVITSISKQVNKLKVYNLKLYRFSY